MSFDLRRMAMSMISQNPNIASNPQAQEFVRVIQNGDVKRGQQIADNLCETYGVSREEALQKAKSFFHIPF